MGRDSQQHVVVVFLILRRFEEEAREKVSWRERGKEQRKKKEKRKANGLDSHSSISNCLCCTA